MKQKQINNINSWRRTKERKLANRCFEFGTQELKDSLLTPSGFAVHYTTLCIWMWWEEYKHIDLLTFLNYMANVFSRNLQDDTSLTGTLGTLIVYLRWCRPSAPGQPPASDWPPFPWWWQVTLDIRWSDGRQKRKNQVYDHLSDI